MSGGGGKGGGKTGSGAKTKDIAQPWAPMQPYLTGQAAGKNPAATGIFPEAERLYNQGPSMYAGLNDQQKQGQTLSLDYANNFGSMYNPYAQTGQAALNNGLNPETNPYAQYGLTNAVASGLQNPSANSNPYGLGGAIQQGLQSPTANSNPFGINSAIQQGLRGPNVNNNPALDAFANAATRPLEQQFNMSTLPGIRSQYGGAGQYGSSRQGVSEGVAKGLTNQAIGDMRANIYSNAYGQGLNQQANALGAANQAYGQGLQGQLGFGSLANSAYGQDINRQQGAMAFAGNAQGQGLDQQARALSLYPQLLQAGLTPANLYQQVGLQNQENQQGMNMEPYQRLQQYANILNGQQSANNAGTSSRSDATKQGWFDTGLQSLLTLGGLFG